MCVLKEMKERESVVGVCKGEKKRACVFVCVCRVCVFCVTQILRHYTYIVGVCMHVVCVSECVHVCVCVCVSVEEERGRGVTIEVRVGAWSELSYSMTHCLTLTVKINLCHMI